MPFVVSKKIAHSVFDDTARLEKSETTAFCSFLLILYIEAKRRCFAFFITKKEEDKSMTEEIMEVLKDSRW